MKLLFTSFLLFAAFLSIGTNASAQWKQSTGFNNSAIVRGFLSYQPYVLVDATTPGGATIDSLYASTDNGQTWIPFAPNGGVPLAAVLIGTTPNLIGTASYPIPGGLQGILSYSTNFGKTWAPDTLGWPGTNGLASLLVTVGSTIFGTNGQFGIYQQTSPGARWTPDTTGIGFGVTVYSITALIASGNNLFIGTFGGGIFLSTNMGASWTPVNNGIPSPQSGAPATVTAFTVSGSSVFAMIGHNGFLDSLYDFYRTTNNGLTWTQTNSKSQNWGFGVSQFTASSQNLFAVSNSGTGVNVSADNGATWFQANQGLPALEVSSNDLGAIQVSGGVSGGNLVLGTGSSGTIWTHKLSDFAPSSVSAGNVPNSFSLSESYPNPVSSTSKINYSLAKDGIASLTLFDVTGKQISVLASGNQISGDHTASFDGSALPAGMYFYRLTTAEGSIGHWLQLIK